MLDINTVKRDKRNARISLVKIGRLHGGFKHALLKTKTKYMSTELFERCRNEYPRFTILQGRTDGEREREREREKERERGGEREFRKPDTTG